MTRPRDAAARRRALNDLDSTLLVEAGAGTGKTSLLAGRLAMLLASGEPPRNIAAITFTELAASELAGRVGRLLTELLRGVVPPFLEEALPNGLSAVQAARLAEAAQSLDALTVTTIHGFCQELIRGYAVEADIDPGAQVADRDGADLLFDRVFDRWLERRLSDERRRDDPLLVLAREDPRRMAEELRALARFRQDHRGSRPPQPDLTGRPDLDLSDAVDTFRRWSLQAPPEPGTATLLDELERLAAFFADRFATPPTFDNLWAMTTLPALNCLVRGGLGLRRPRGATAWRRVAGDDGARLEAEALARFEQVETAYAQLLAQVGGALVHVLSAQLDEVLDDYAADKRRAALLDFDDLLHLAARLLRDHPPVRQALSERFGRILVDEFQDTDPLQCEIIFRLCAKHAADDWTEAAPRPGALFLVGDPKQAIYRFRGASVETYEAAKDLILRAPAGDVIQITANFRSRPAILEHVNLAFAGPLAAPGQPGYVGLEETRPDATAAPAAVRLPVSGPPDLKRADAQDAEAEVVAEACRRLVGTELLLDAEERPRAVSPSDIALLAPTGTDLWRYERALEEAGLPFASQAGKGLWRRQESQDLLTLARVLADRRDTLAFGALLRGPLVGLTDEVMLDALGALPRTDDAPGELRVDTPLEHVCDSGLRDVLLTLQPLHRKARSTTPAQLLGEAVERLGVRPILSLRHPDGCSASLANVDALLARAADYGVLGLRRLVRDLTVEWRERRPAVEGRAEIDAAAVEIVTMHSAKGLQWPVVIPINAMVQTRSPAPYIHRRDDNSLHWRLGNVDPPALATTIKAEADAEARQRTRLWYVACTRAEDLLILPDLAGTDARSWARVVDLRLGELPVFDMRGVPRTPTRSAEVVQNSQNRATFEAEAARIAQASPPVAWLRPSQHDGDRSSGAKVVADGLDAGDEAPASVGGGRLRGLVLHKLLEEVIEIDLPEDRAALTARAATLLAQASDPLDRAAVPEPEELARTTLATLALPEIAALRPRLRAELPVYVTLTENGRARPLSGRIDAVAVDEDGRIDLVLDWKSDVAPAEATVQGHAEQLRLYLAAVGAPRGALVYMSLERVIWIDR